MVQRKARQLGRQGPHPPEPRTPLLPLQRDASSHSDDRELNELIGELTVNSSDFRAWRAQHKVYECTSGRKRLHHPLIGQVDIDYQTFPVPGEPRPESDPSGAAAASRRTRPPA